MIQGGFCRRISLLLWQTPSNCKKTEVGKNLKRGSVPVPPLPGALYHTERILCVKYSQNACEPSGDGSAAVVLAAAVTVAVMNKIYPPKAKAAEDEEANTKADEKE